MLVDDMLFEQVWFAELPLRQRFLYIYLLTKCTKVGIFEVNLRKMTYDINDGLPVTRDDIFIPFGNRIQPLGESKGIFVDYIAFNWQREKPLDPAKNPLHRGLAQELAKHGLSFNSINAMANKKLKWIGECNGDDSVNTSTVHSVEPVVGQGRLEDEWFTKFWSAYPSSCPRKVDKKKCRDKFHVLMKSVKEPDHLFESIMAGLELWKQSQMWNSNNGAFIKAPLVWLNGACWNDEPMKGNGNGNQSNGQGVKRSDNSIVCVKSDISNLF